MVTKTMACVKCGGAMEEGFVLDRGHYDTRKVTEWVEGEPEPSLWLGLKTSGRAVLKVATWRCTDCGFLESYARKPLYKATS